MSRENVELVMETYDAFNRGELNQVLDAMSDDHVTYRGQPFADTFHGKEGFLEATADWTEGFSDWSVTPEEFIDAGDHVVVQMVQEARGEQSSAPVTGSFWFVHSIAAGKQVRLGMYMRESEALEAAGLRE
jgi:ketosteroid isomerase-like protein